MALAANTAGTVAIRGALLLVLLVGALVSTAEATRNSGLGAGSVAAAPVASVHTSSMVGCVMNCGIQVTNCGIACANKSIFQAPECLILCGEDNAKCALACVAPAQGPAPPQA